MQIFFGQLRHILHVMAANWTRWACLALALTLSGTPAALAACAAACQPGMTHSMGEGASPAGPHASDAHTHACCPDPQGFSATPVAVVRSDAQAPVPVVTGTAAADALRSTTPTRVAFATRSGPALRTRCRAPLVLRL